MSGRYQGWMPTRMLRDDAIQPTEYRRWAEAEERFARRRQDVRVMAELLATVPREGLREPILLGVDDLDHRVYVSDGHHRAVAVRQLGAPRFPFRWCWIRAYRVEHANDPFPYHLLGLEATA
ncbi:MULTISPECIES: ParB N-terminal domain-containing protein [unclassified Streptomyces]|uniref:ParB N-terminal domain-containing protein n=1 Tax=unclassified Streptomyces TaxID=2593676 RepID=UPI0035E33CDB